MTRKLGENDVHVLQLSICKGGTFSCVAFAAAAAAAA
jgi:hypothetical protein